MTEKKSSYLGKNISFEGDINIKGELDSDANIKGNIKGNTFRQKSMGISEGSIQTEELINEGNIKGDVVANKITLKKNSKTEGNLSGSDIVIEKGSHFQVNAKNKN